MLLISLFAVFFVLIVLAIFIVAFIEKFFFRDKPTTPSTLAKIIGPILIIISIMEWFSFILFPFILALLKLSNEDIQDIFIVLLVCFLSGICGFTLSFDYYQRYYKVPKNKEIMHNKTNYETKGTPFTPRQFE